MLGQKLPVPPHDAIFSEIRRGTVRGRTAQRCDSESALAQRRSTAFAEGSLGFCDPDGAGIRRPARRAQLSARRSSYDSNRPTAVSNGPGTEVAVSGED
jgi:hypothetical protein